MGPFIPSVRSGTTATGSPYPIGAGGGSDPTEASQQKGAPDLSTEEGLTAHLNSMAPEDRLQPAWVAPSVLPHLINAFGKSGAVVAHPGVQVTQTAPETRGLNGASIPPASEDPNLPPPATGGNPVTTAPPAPNSEYNYGDRTGMNIPPNEDVPANPVNTISDGTPNLSDIISGQLTPIGDSGGGIQTSPNTGFNTNDSSFGNNSDPLNFLNTGRSVNNPAIPTSGDTGPTMINPATGKPYATATIGVGLGGYGGMGQYSLFGDGSGGGGSGRSWAEDIDQLT